MGTGCCGLGVLLGVGDLAELCCIVEDNNEGPGMSAIQVNKKS